MGSLRACVEKAQPLACGGSPPLFDAWARPHARTAVGADPCVRPGGGKPRPYVW
ncbi:MAG: hypothetical protein FWH21_08540 [Kiritimatiellaeota bacterium]|nr:hypothetical protein [Kiritimatiellota bacterium]